MEGESKQQGNHLTPEEYAKQKKRLDYLMKVKRMEDANLREGAANTGAPNDRAEGESPIKKLERLLEERKPQ